MEVAMFKHISAHDYLQWETCGTKSMEGQPGYVRVSEYVEVAFPPLGTDTVVQAQLAALDTAERELHNKFNDAMGGITRRRSELRALTVQS